MIQNAQQTEQNLRPGIGHETTREQRLQNIYSLFEKLTDEELEKLLRIVKTLE